MPPASGSILSVICNVIHLPLLLLSINSHHIQDGVDRTQQPPIGRSISHTPCYALLPLRLTNVFMQFSQSMPKLRSQTTLASCNFLVVDQVLFPLYLRISVLASRFHPTGFPPRASGLVIISVGVLDGPMIALQPTGMAACQASSQLLPLTPFYLCHPLMHFLTTIKLPLDLV